MMRPAWRGRSTKPRISGSSTRTLAWPRRPGTPPRPSGRPRRSAGQVRPRSDRGRPACELYLYPSGKVFARETNQPENSPGFSTMMCNGNRVVARRMNLRADHPLLVTAILPHEVTHVVLADLFTTQQIPRWADEGIAVLAEPNAEQETRAAELQEPLEAGRVFDLRKLMAMDYPDAKDWSLYYAQSVSLDSLPGRTRTARTVRAVRPEFAARRDRGCPARHLSDSPASPSCKNDGRNTRDNGSHRSRRPVATRVLNQPAPSSNDSARMRPSPARRSPVRPGRSRSTRFGPIGRSWSAR